MRVNKVERDTSLQLLDYMTINESQGLYNIENVSERSKHKLPSKKLCKRVFGEQLTTYIAFDGRRTWVWSFSNDKASCELHVSIRGMSLIGNPSSEFRPLEAKIVEALNKGVPYHGDT